MSRARRIDRSKENPYQCGEKVHFQFEGNRLSGFANEPLAVSLLANGVHIFGRSVKYHRPRGPSCLHGHCSSCLMRVDDVPNVRSCQVTAREDMKVERQAGWPSSSRDLFRMVDWTYGKRMDHHGMFTASAVVNRMAMGFIRKMAGFGHPATSAPRPANPVEERRVQVLVVGAGAAGLTAAAALIEAGQEVLVMERADLAGGRLLDLSCRVENRRAWGRVKKMSQALEETDKAELRLGMTALAAYQTDDGVEVLATDEAVTWILRPERLLCATGGYGQIPLFENNDLPGILSLRGGDKLLGGWGVVPAEPIVVAGDSRRAQQLAVDLAEGGVKVTALVCDKPAPELRESFKAMSIEVVSGLRILRAGGTRWLNRVELARPGQSLAEQVIDCGLLAADGPESPAYELAHHAGCRVEFRSESGHVVRIDEEGRTSDRAIFAAGHCAGAEDDDSALRAGQVAGLACALSLEERPELRKRLDRLLCRTD